LVSERTEVAARKTKLENFAHEKNNLLEGKAMKFFHPFVPEWRRIMGGMLMIWGRMEQSTNTPQFRRKYTQCDDSVKWTTNCKRRADLLNFLRCMGNWANLFCFQEHYIQYTK
jgi:hypothetical protein